ncbi:hypothetical protein [Archangium primigenium]|uniref:hypothetical protein n=1 Tax=[Archangium] primigenium TaxID=2792470 RepID=UPI00195D3901|nr:hypothetical protein [Archangium primigenium]MBM7115887.1 hypothetical protein [Archangium primigenium]
MQPVRPLSPEAAAPVSPLADGVPRAEAVPVRWSLGRRLAFRFFFAYVVLYGVPFPLEALGWDAAQTAVEAFWRSVVPWLGAHVLRLDAPIAVVPTGSGDTLYDCVRMALIAVLAAGVTGAWSWVDRMRSEYTRAHDVLRVYVRYYVASALLSYGLSKVFHLQFAAPGPERMLQPLGQFSPMGLLWTFMGVSPGYNLFTGGAEVLGAVLLFWRRTTTLGAMVLAVVMTHVVALNVFYDVPVKFWSSYLLGLCVFLMLPDVKRLAQVLVLHQTAVAAPPRPFLAVSGWKRWALGGAKWSAVAWLVYAPAHARWEVRQAHQDFPLMGLYTVESFQRDGQARPLLVGDRLGWRHVTINARGVMQVRTLDDARVHYFRLTDDPTRRTLTLGAMGGPPVEAPVFTYERPDAAHLVLKGRLYGADIEARLRGVDTSRSELLGRGFRWIQEVPYNR